eukprot:m.48414 g.48414  ORF g.48414 m.48414 type:complete len:178 (-) comp8914_c0_seq1:558-1091(-)
MDGPEHRNTTPHHNNAQTSNAQAVACNYSLIVMIEMHAHRRFVSCAVLSSAVAAVSVAAERAPSVLSLGLTQKQNGTSLCKSRVNSVRTVKLPELHQQVVPVLLLLACGGRALHPRVHVDMTARRCVPHPKLMHWPGNVDKCARLLRILHFPGIRLFRGRRQAHGVVNVGDQPSAEH